LLPKTPKPREANDKSVAVVELISGELSVSVPVALLSLSPDPVLGDEGGKGGVHGHDEVLVLCQREISVLVGVALHEDLLVFRTPELNGLLLNQGLVVSSSELAEVEGAVSVLVDGVNGHLALFNSVGLTESGQEGRELSSGHEAVLVGIDHGECEGVVLSGAQDGGLLEEVGLGGHGILHAQVGRGVDGLDGSNCFECGLHIF